MGLGALITLNGVPTPSLSGAGQVIVYERYGETTYYQIRYPIDIVDGDISRIGDSSLDPGSILGVTVLADIQPACLVKGPVIGQSIHLEDGGAGSYVVVKGADTSLTMAREFKSQVWPNVSDSEAVMAILGTYGLIPDVTPTTARHLELKHSLVQRQSDLDFVRKLARRNGFIFWVDCNPLFIETAHFKRPNLLAPALMDLNINQEDNNIESFDIVWDAERPTSVQGIQLDLGTKTPIPAPVLISPQTGLGALNLQSITRDLRSIYLAAPVDDAGDMLARNEGALIEADWFIMARCRTSIHQTGGRLVRAHEVVNVNGAGSRHSGKYLVAEVKHIIDHTAHVMEIELIRNAWNPSGLGIGPL
ncbi:MAG: hypothetical protein MI974_05000 [Chitinophagales bacterium]|nr:hypothetical protein [Chitinophagales bacterium]